MRNLKSSLLCILLLTGCVKERFQLPSRNITTVTASLPIYGMDILGLAKQNINYLCAESDKNGAGGELAGTFGDIRPKLSTWAACSNQVANRVHLIDGTVNNHACSGNVTNSSLLIKKAQLMRAFMPMAASIKKWYCSPVLEHGCTSSSIVNKWYAILQKYWPECISVCSSNGKGYCPKGVLKENHGGGHGDITSGDGISTFDADSIDFRSSAKVMALSWHNCMNGRLTSEKPGQPVPLPPNRVNWCSQEEIRHAVRIMREPSPKPALLGCKDILPPNIGKPRSENYGVGHGDNRQNKPMLILKQKTSRFSLQKITGQEVGCFSNYQPPATPGQRYYEGNCSGKNPTELQDLLGSEWGKLVGGGQCYIYNPIRRLGVYR